MAKQSQFPFIDFCRQHRCYRELEQQLNSMDKSYVQRMTRLDVRGKLPSWHSFYRFARRLDYVTRQLRLFFGASNAVSIHVVCGAIPCKFCWYERM